MIDARIQDALYAIPADVPRDDWWRMAAALKTECGDPAFDLFDTWSAQAASYKPASVKSTWRSVKPGHISIGSLYHMAEQHGWRGERAESKPATPKRDYRAEERKQQIAWQKATQEAQEMISAASFESHPYLVSKGFPEHQGFVLNGELLLPMRDICTGKLNSLQRIKSDGSKKFLFGGRAKGSVFQHGRGSEVFLVEGYATALSLLEALRALYRQATVIVCYSAQNIPVVAQTRGHYVVADNDSLKTGTGEREAVKTGLPWWMPPVPGDANDYHQSEGLDALKEAVRNLTTQKQKSPVGGAFQ